MNRKTSIIRKINKKKDNSIFEVLNFSNNNLELKGINKLLSRITNYRNNQIDGEYKCFHENGKVSFLAIYKDGEIVGVTAQDIPVFVPEKEEPKETDKVEIDKENIVQIEENIPEQESIVIDEASGESIPPISKSKRGFPNRKSKIDSMYVDDAELAFRKKENK
jgi:uncharacterized pyridoxamine 5'-phosphate oxidase family protein